MSERVKEQMEKEQEPNLHQMEVLLNEALASNFPDWDLTPPETMIKRNGSRFS